MPGGSLPLDAGGIARKATHADRGANRIRASCALLGRLFASFLFAAASPVLPARADVPVPPLAARVTDLTGTLDERQRAALEQTLAAFEARKGSQIAVLLVPTTKPETIEQYSIRVVEHWKLGRKGVDDGALLLAAMQDRAVRIEVGYGLEGALPDALAKRLVEEQVIPRFRQGDFFGGIQAGVAGIMRAINGEPLPPPRGARGGVQGFGIDGLLGLAFVLVFVIGGLLRAVLGRIGGSGAVGAIAGVAAWLIAGSVIVAVVIGIAMFVLSLFGGVAMAAGGRGRGGWYPGGGGFGGGGYGGGGGGFGGGGASGRW